MTDLETAVHAAGLDPAGLKPRALPALATGAFELKLPGRGAIEAWRALRKEVGPLGFWPVIAGEAGDDPWIDLEGNREAILAAAEHRNIDAWVAERYEELAEDGVEPPIGTWPVGAETSSDFVIHRNLLDDSYLPLVALVLVPARDSAEALAALAYGNWNDCPDPATHVAAARMWADRYDAVLVGASQDTLEFEVARPPQDPPGALALARTQYAYCTDIVDQGLESISVLAATLLRAPVWYFWWD